MNWYVLLMGEANRLLQPLLTSAEDFFGIDYEDLQAGKPRKSWDPRSFVSSTSPEDDGDPDDILGEHLGIPIFHRVCRMRSGLQASARLMSSTYPSDS
jgi:hypothetical protein